MRDRREPKFLSPEAVNGHLGAGARGGSGGGWSAPAGERCRALLARVLARVPFRDLWALLGTTAFVMPEGAGATYLSAKFLGGRHVVLLGEGLLGLSEDEQAAITLPQVARAARGAPHPLERVREGEDDWEEVFDERIEGGLNKRAFERAVRLHDDAVADLKIDVHFAGKEADALARSWQEQWREHARQTA
jgi:hypothetical protein